MQLRLLTLLIAFLGILNVANAQHKTIFYKGDTVNRSDKKGLWQGKWMKFYKTDTIFYVGQFKDSKPQGTFKYYYASGKLKATNTYDAAGKSAHTIIYHESGPVMAKGKYIDQKKDSVWEYFDENGKLKSREFYVNGLQTGIWTTFYPDGKKVEEIAWEKGKKNGLWKQYFQNGTLKFDGMLKDGIPVGSIKMYHPNGNLWLMGKYKNGVKDGFWNVYFENQPNVIDRKDIYKDGILTNPIKDNSFRDIPIKDDDDDGQ